MATRRKNKVKLKKTLQLTQMVNTEKMEEQEEDLEIYVTGDSLSESSHDLESDYFPSSSESSEDERVKPVSRFKKGKGKCQELLGQNFEKKSAEEPEDREHSEDLEKDCRADSDDKDKDEKKLQVITVKPCVKGEKRNWDKKHYCVYCKVPQTKMARHLIRRHSDEKEVAPAACLPPNSKKRQEILELIRRKGNYLHNIEVLQKGQGEIIPYRCPSEYADANDYLPCNVCYGFFLKAELWRHERVCGQKMNQPVKSKKKKRVQSAALSLLPSRGQPSQRCSKIISRMVIDEVSREVKNDQLICEFGDRLLEKHGSEQSKDGHVSQKMRELGRFVLAAKSLDPKVNTLQDVLVPPMFSLAVAAAKKASGYTKSKYRYDTPSLALKLGHSLKTICEIVIGKHVKAEDEAAARRVRSFLGLLAAEWGLYVSHHARTNLEEGRWNKKEMIPLTEDVMKLHKVLKFTEEEAKKTLLEGPNPSAYKTLSECLLSQIILFNRRRQGEAAKMPLAAYRDRALEEPNKDVMQCLSKLEQNLSHEFTRFVIRGKRGRKVPVLLTKEMTISLDFLLDKRSADNEILDSNQYVFARQNSGSHLRGSDCLRKYASVSGATRPETLTSTQLRKHVATLSQLMNLKENELDQLAKFMGHDIRVHREYYRLTENTLQLAKVSKLLIAIEHGTEVYKGKSLDEIDSGLETALSAKESEVRQSNEVSMDISFEQAQDLDELDILSQGVTTPGFSDELNRKKMGSPEGTMSKRLPQPAQDSHEEPQRTSSPQSSDMLARTKKTVSSKRKLSKRTCEPAQDKDVSPRRKMSKKTCEPAQDSDEEPDINQVTSTGEPSNDSQRTEKMAMGQHILKPRAFHRRPWSSAEKAAVWRQLGQYITLQRVPGKEPCLKALKAEPVLESRSWRDIKNNVYNTINAKKRKEF